MRPFGPSWLTDDEQERAAYQRGDVQHARALSDAADEARQAGVLKTALEDMYESIIQTDYTDRAAAEILLGQIMVAIDAALDR